MREKCAVALGVAALSFGSGSAALAVSSNHFTPGTPGTSNCEAQTGAMLAQNATLWSTGSGGLAGAAEMLGYSSTSDLQAAISAYCNDGGPLP